MRIKVNGEVRDIKEGVTVTALLEQLTVPSERVVVELNLTILKRAQHAGTLLKEGDQVEIVHFVGGGSEERTQDSRPKTQGKVKESRRGEKA